jgi:hypothetical protein
VTRAGLLGLLVGLAGMVGCGGDDSPTASGTCVAASADIRDALGDARSVPSTPAPDMISASLVVHDCQLHVDVTFAPGALVFHRAWAMLSMDTDQNAATGNPYPQGLGTDYELQLGPGLDAFLFNVATHDVTVLQATVVTGNTFRATVPLALLGNDDGRMDVRVRANVFGPNPADPHSGMGQELDWMPDLGTPPARLQ